MSFTRRQILTLGSLGVLGLRRAVAMGTDAKLTLALLRHGEGFDRRPGAVEQLMWETTKRTSIDVRERPRALAPTDPDLFRYPLLVWIGTGPCEPFSDDAASRLQRYLRGGGCLFIDDATPPGDDRFDACVRREVPRLLPQHEMTRVSNDHTLYRSFFLLERPYGRIRRMPYLEGVEFDDRSPLLYGRNDLLGAFGRDPLGRWLLPVVPGGPGQREMAFRMGINLLMYATCLNYKRDQVHVTAILRRRRWRVDREGLTR